jgi:hypothetical protein
MSAMLPEVKCETALNPIASGYRAAIGGSYRTDFKKAFSFFGIPVFDDGAPDRRAFKLIKRNVQ